MADREEKKKGTSKALPFTKELQEMNRELYSACMVLKLNCHHHLCHLLWLF